LLESLSKGGMTMAFAVYPTIKQMRCPVNAYGNFYWRLNSGIAYEV
jgi:hypothetical protein